MISATEKEKKLGIRHRYQNEQLEAFFRPQNVALIGATENVGSVGRTVLQNLIASPFGGAVFPVNPKRPSVLGIKAYKSIAEVPEKVDLAIVVTPAPSIPGIIRECGEAGVSAAVVISAGFKEIGAEGKKLESMLLEEARTAKIRIIGPNCLGVMCPISGLNATFATAIARPGTVGFISQSGALCTGVLDWSFQANVGFSAFMSIGSMVDVGWGDLIDYLGEDQHTKSIVIYMESVGDARAFLSAAREVALIKPIIVIKAGRTEQASKAAASHTGALTGSDEVLDAAFRRCGVLRVNSIAEMFYMADVLGKQPRPKGPRLMILTNAGGPGVLACDALIGDGGELAEVSPVLMEDLNKVLPVTWSHNNPIDIIGDADPKRYAAAVEIVAKDPDADGLLVIMTPQGMTVPSLIAEGLKPYAKLDKPILASWMGGVEVATGVEILNKAGIPAFPYPDTAARMFNYMVRYANNLKAIYETPVADPNADIPDVEEARAIIAKVRESGRTLLTEYESKKLLACYHIPVVPTEIAGDEEKAVALAAAIGYPVVLKLHSETVTHKTDVGGVHLNLKDEQAVRSSWKSMEKINGFQGVTVQPMVKLEGYEIILGSSIDPQFGPVLLFGSGGQLVEVYKDSELSLPPLNTTLARRMMERTRIYKALKGVRGRKPVDLQALEELMVRFSQLVVDHPWVKELDINPLLANSERLLALDARVVVYGNDVQASELPKPAIRPYPIRYIWSAETRSGKPIMIRPIRPEDEPLMAQFHEGLSEQSVYFRYFRLMKLQQRISHERLTRICFIDYDRELALVAERAGEKGVPEIVGVGRITRIRGTHSAEFAVIVADKMHNQGIGTELLRHMLDVARAERIDRLGGEILPENRAMQKICERVGFALDHNIKDGIVKAEIHLV
jgi:acetyltransferase